MIIALLALGAAASDVIRMERDVAPHDSATSSWELVGTAPREAPMELTVSLKVSKAGRDRLEETFWAVSDPKHARYGKYLKHTDIKKLLGVPDAQVERVKSYFERAGATKVTVSPTNDVLKLKIAAADAERALHTAVGVFRHRERTDQTILRAKSAYHLPAAVAADVTLVGELLQFPALRRKDLANLKGGSSTWAYGCDDTSCDNKVTPAILAQRYNVPYNESTPGESQSTMAVAEFQGQYFKPDDMSLFSSSCHVNSTVDTVIGGNRPSAGIEAELDIEYIRAVSQGTPLTVIYAAQYSLLDWANTVTSMADPPYVHSVSYGNDEKQQSGVDYMDSVNDAFKKAGTLGLSVLFASGDQGVCGREGCGLFKKRFKPDFPGGSPYHTSVGGTNFVTEGVVGEEEVWNDGGGGFSDNFAIPSYQADAVAAFKANSTAMGLLPPQDLWNNTGRGYPDVAALGGQTNPYCIAANGRFTGVAGTSASCPVVAGIFARLNGLRLAAGKAPMGFLNPWIYQNSHAFQDVTKGKNNPGAEKYGFSAIPGWDAATGVGTPDYQKMSQAI